ncbi:MAG TPA: phosphoenolpyruvate--protein phosphotransferase [Bacilli bacterium]
MLKGIPVTPDIAIGPALVLVNKEQTAKKRIVPAVQIPHEKEKINEAIDKAKKEIVSVMKSLEDQGLSAEAGIIEGQYMLLSDDNLLSDMDVIFANESCDAAWAVHKVFEQYIHTFELMEDEYLKERIQDLRDIRQRLLALLNGDSLVKLHQLPNEVIIAAYDLTPSMTAQIDKSKVKGFVTEIGSGTSHTAILARTLSIPAVVGCQHLTEEIHDGDLVIIDGKQGIIFINPDEAILREYREKKKQWAKFRSGLDELKVVRPVTKDGLEVELLANIGHHREAEMIEQYGADGVGLFRTEFLFMDKNQMPSEEEQFAAYSSVVRRMNGKPTTIRTLDLGGDKKVPYIDFPAEMNPFLGFRAVRFFLKHPDILRTQLRAIIRAGQFGPIRIMFPMISTVHEMIQCRRLAEEVMEELKNEGRPTGENIQIGMMIEVPSAALITDQLTDFADFFSIGTNDLIQYTIAVDRMNENVGYLYNPTHPAVLRLISFVCKKAKEKGKMVGMCGEMAGDPAYTEILLALGLDELSMSPSQIPLIKNNIINISLPEARGKLDAVMKERSDANDTA